MIHLIQNRKNLYDIVVTGENHEVLHHSRQGFERKMGAHNHIMALAEQLGNYDGVNFQDNTGEVPAILYVNRKLDIFPTNVKASKKYVV